MITFTQTEFEAILDAAAAVAWLRNSERKQLRACAKPGYKFRYRCFNSDVGACPVELAFGPSATLDRRYISLAFDIDDRVFAFNRSRLLDRADDWIVEVL